MITYSIKYDNIFPMCLTIFINRMDPHAMMLDEERTAGLDSFNNNNNANFSLYICNIHFELKI